MIGSRNAGIFSLWAFALLAVVAVACSSGASTQQAASAPAAPGIAAPEEVGFRGPSNAVLSAQDRADITYVEKLPMRGSSADLDLSDPAQYRFIQRQWAIAGVTQQRFPQLYRMLAKVHQNDMQRRTLLHASQPLNLTHDITQTSTTTQPIVPINFVTRFAAATGGQYTATAITSVPGTLPTPGTATSTTIGLYDQNNNQLGPATTVLTNGNGAYMLNPNTAPTPASGDVLAVGTYLYTTVINGQPVTKAGRLYTRQSLRSTTAGQWSMVNVQPSDVNGNGTIKVCIARRDADCDYFATAAPGPQFIVQFPIKANYTIPDTPQPLASQSASPIQPQIYVMQSDAGGGGGCTLPANFSLWANSTLSGNTLSWNVSPAPFPNPSGASSPCFPNNSNVIYDLQVTMLGTSGGQATSWFGEIKTTQNPPPIPPPGTAYLVGMVVAYGCVASDTQVAMADGAARPVQTVAINDVIRAPDNGTFKVTNVTTGLEGDDMIDITTQNHLELLLTQTHPVVTAHGYMMARDLRPGTIVVTKDGLVALASVKRRHYTGKVWNLSVAPTAQTEHRHTTTFFANGILVGDAHAQGAVELAYRAMLAAKADRVSPQWRVDMANYNALVRAQHARKTP
jgi:hypothetical protein